MTTRTRRLLLSVTGALALAGLLLAGAPSPARAETQDQAPSEPITCANCVGGQCAQLRCLEKGGDMVVEPCHRLEPGCTGEGGYLDGQWGTPRPPGGGGENDDDLPPWQDELWECDEKIGSPDFCRDLEDLIEVCEIAEGTLAPMGNGDYRCIGYAGSTESLLCTPYGSSGKVFVCTVYQEDDDSWTAPDPLRRPAHGLRRPVAGAAARLGTGTSRHPGVPSRALGRTRTGMLERPAATPQPTVTAPAPAAPTTKSPASFTLDTQQCSDAPAARRGYVWKCDHWERARAR